MDVSDGAEAAARGDEAVMRLHAGQLADPANGHRGGRGGVRHPRGTRHGVAVVQLSLMRKKYYFWMIFYFYVITFLIFNEFLE